MTSNFLIKDKFLEFDTDFKQNQNQEKNLLNKIKHLCSTSNYSSELIEEIDDNNYNLYDQEIKYKIFEDISSVSKKNNSIELILDIPIDDNTISINKIKLSSELNKYINDIYVCVDDEKIISHIDSNQNSNSNGSQSTIAKHILNEKIINCQHNKNITLHILLKNNVINKIINKNIFVNYSFAIIKNKIKFI